jgi:hypothetical protein
MRQPRHRALAVSIRLAKLAEDSAAQELSIALGKLDLARTRVGQVRAAIDESDVIGASSDGFEMGLSYRSLLQLRLPCELGDEESRQEIVRLKMETLLQAHQAKQLFARALESKLTQEQDEREKREMAAMLELSQMLAAQMRRRDAKH